MSKEKSEFRIERDSMGEMEVPADSLYGATTMRACLNFPISGTPVPDAFITALAVIKSSCAKTNQSLGLLDQTKAQAIIKAAAMIENRTLDNFSLHFPIDVYQTGSGTSSNMNVNEVISNLCKQAGVAVHPNDEVNCSQSSNDCVPTAIAIASVLEAKRTLLPALQTLDTIITKKANSLTDVVTTGRTHLMDAMPVTFAQILGSWSAQIQSASARIQDSLKRVALLPQGGTAVGTGINAHPEFARRFCTNVSAHTQYDFFPMHTKFEGMSSVDGIVELSGQCNALAVALMKIANDLRWMNSGPLAGLGEISLPALKPGSSIMPGKVNPVIPEAVAMVSAQTIGYHTAITVAGQSGNFQLNVMLPLVAP